MMHFDSEIGILAVGHGSREPKGNEPLLELCRNVEERAGRTPVQPCYLEFVQPAIDEGLAALHRRGVTRVIVIPLQLTTGRHVRHDIPRQVERSLAKLSDSRVRFANHLGSHPGLVQIADSRLQEALDGRPDCSTQYVLVARGSRDPLVRGEVVELANKRRIASQTAGFMPCFLSMTEPSFEHVLQLALAQSPDRIVVQPYFLYPGKLLGKMETRVDELRRQFPHVEWVLAGPLGPDPRLAECVLDLAFEVSEPNSCDHLVR